jgi:hypothetical protein
VSDQHQIDGSAAAWAAAGALVTDPRDLVSIPIRRTHAYNFMHRVMGKNGPPGVKFHKGTPDIYFIIGVRATLINRRANPEPRVHRGTPWRVSRNFDFKMVKLQTQAGRRFQHASLDSTPIAA